MRDDTYSTTSVSHRRYNKPGGRPRLDSGAPTSTRQRSVNLPTLLCLRTPRQSDPKSIPTTISKISYVRHSASLESAVTDLHMFLQTSERTQRIASRFTPQFECRNKCGRVPDSGAPSSCRPRANTTVHERSNATTDGVRRPAAVEDRGINNGVVRVRVRTALVVDMRACGWTQWYWVYVGTRMFDVRPTRSGHSLICARADGTGLSVAAIDHTEQRSI